MGEGEIEPIERVALKTVCKLIASGKSLCNTGALNVVLCDTQRDGMGSGVRVLPEEGTHMYS